MTEAKAAIVTAGGRGIGAACARALAERGYGLALMSPSGSAEALAARVGDVDWMLSYQSAARTGEPWLGPPIEQVIADLAEEGCRNVLIAPIGFVCDHIEVLYDIDIRVQEIARGCGVRVERTESMNCNPMFIRAVADAVLETMDN